MYNLSLFVWLHRYSVCFKKKKNQENKLKPTAFAISSSAPELFNYNSYLWVIVLWQVMCIWYVQYRIMIGVQNTSIWQAVRKKTLKFSLVRGSMVRGSLHHKISHNIENYLQWDFFFSFFFSVDFTVYQSDWKWFWHCLWQKLSSSLFYIIFLGETVGCTHRIT